MQILRFQSRPTKSETLMGEPITLWTNASDDSESRSKTLCDRKRRGLRTELKGHCWLRTRNQHKRMKSIRGVEGNPRDCDVSKDKKMFLKGELIPLYQMLLNNQIRGG